MADKQVQCVNKTDRTNYHERIMNIGGGTGSSRWKYSEDDAIVKIEREGWSFFTLDAAGKRVKVIIASRLGKKYLKTASDGEQPDNLLSLPECP